MRHSLINAAVPGDGPPSLRCRDRTAHVVVEVRRRCCWDVATRRRPSMHRIPGADREQGNEHSADPSRPASRRARGRPLHSTTRRVAGWTVAASPDHGDRRRRRGRRPRRADPAPGRIGRDGCDERAHQPAGTDAGRAGRWRAVGKADAPVTLEVWTDFQCPICGQFAKTVEPALMTQVRDPRRASDRPSRRGVPGCQEQRVVRRIRGGRGRCPLRCGPGSLLAVPGLDLRQPGR